MYKYINHSLIGIMMHAHLFQHGTAFYINFREIPLVFTNCDLLNFYTQTLLKQLNYLF
jgi:hypothetical protein